MNNPKSNIVEIEEFTIAEEDLMADYKPSFCYACGQEIIKIALLICSDCLDDSCEEFVALAEK